MTIWQWFLSLFKPATPPKPPAPPPATPPTATRRRRVVIVGINIYGGGSDLAGCVTDARRWEKRYLAAGYTVRLLLDAQATRDAIVDAVRWSLDGAVEGDEAGLVVSSHGTRLPDPRDPSGEVAAICAADCLKDNRPGTFEAGCITAPQLADIVRPAAKRGVRWHFLGDLCHGETEVSSLAWMRSLWSGPPAPGRARFLPAPAALQRPGAKLSTFIPPADRKVAIAAGLRSLLMTGSLAAGTSADAVINGIPCGAFSYYLGRAFDLEPGKGIADLITATHAALKKARYEQEPTVTGDPARLKAPAPWAAAP